VISPEYGGSNYLQNIRTNLPDYLLSNTGDYKMNHEQHPQTFTGGEIHDGTSFKPLFILVPCVKGISKIMFVRVPK